MYCSLSKEHTLDSTGPRTIVKMMLLGGGGGGWGVTSNFSNGMSVASKTWACSVITRQAPTGDICMSATCADKPHCFTTIHMICL